MNLLGTDKAVGFMRGIKNYVITFIKCFPCAIDLPFLFFFICNPILWRLSVRRTLLTVTEWLSARF